MRGQAPVAGTEPKFADNATGSSRRRKQITQRFLCPPSANRSLPRATNPLLVLNAIKERNNIPARIAQRLLAHNLTAKDFDIERIVGNGIEKHVKRASDAPRSTHLEMISIIKSSDLPAGCYVA